MRQHLKELNFATCGKRPEFVPENIFYRLAMKAKNDVAEAFQAKVAYVQSATGWTVLHTGGSRCSWLAGSHYLD